MRKIFIISAFVILTALQGYAQQQTYGNEWINDYSQFYFKIKVTKDGIQRIPYSTLTNYIPSSQLNSGKAGDNFIVFHEGEAIPIYVTTSGKMQQGDYIEFYAEGNDGSFDTQLFKSASKQLHTYYSLFNDTAVYYLTMNNKTGNPRLQNMANNTNSAQADDYLLDESLQVLTNKFSRGTPHYIGNSPFYSSLFEEGEGFIGRDFTTGNSRSYSINTPFAYKSGPPATFKTSVLSKSTGKHSINIKLNGTSIHSTSNSFTGHDLRKHTITSGILNLLSTNNTVEYEALGPNPDRNAVSFIKITYPRQYDFGNESTFDFELNSNTPNQRHLAIQNFDDQGTNPILYDLSMNRRIVGSSASSGSSHHFYLNYTTGRNNEMFLSSQNEIRVVSNLQAKKFRNFIDPKNQGDYIIISHKKFKNDGNGNNWLEKYQQLRDKSSGGEYDVTVVMIDELYDQFAFGINKHPLSIRNFANFVADNWNPAPSHIFLIGKARGYNSIRNNTGNYEQTLVPTFGNPPSDNLITASVDDITPRIATGRLSAEKPSSLKIYYDKMVQFERKQDEVGNPYQTISNKAWMKHALHLGGGEGASQQGLFKSWLNQFEQTIEDSLYGGHVTSFFKKSPSPIQIAQSEYLHSRIDSGVSLITFFGHSSPNSFDFNLDSPENYSNVGKYPLILSNGCFTGNIFRGSPGISEDFVLADQRGSIGFMATTGLSYSSGLFTYSNNLYENFSHQIYGKTIGEAKRLTIQEVVDCCPNLFNKLVLQEMTLNGDPAISLNTHERPDYALERPQVSFKPSVVTTNLDSFDLQIINYNLGKAIHDSMTVEVTRRFPNGNEIGFTKKIKTTYFRDTIRMTIPMGEGNVFGQNNFRIEVDAGDDVQNEISETNNVLGFSDIPLFIQSEDIFPIHPYEFSIVPEKNVTLKASTANAFAKERRYAFEIDTTELFNSPMKQRKEIVQSGGILKWQPPIQYIDSTVYYWRVSIDSSGQKTYNWHNTSFIYIKDEYPGWNQSHFFQFLKDDYTNLKLDNTRSFKFEDDVKDVEARAGTWEQRGGSLPWGMMASYVNGVELHVWNCGGNGGFSRGLTIAVFDSTTGLPWESELNDVQGGINQVYGNIHCKNTRNFRAFPFPTYNSSWYQKIIDFINQVPDGNYVLIYSVNNPRYQDFDQSLINRLQTLGSNQVSNLANMANGAPWGFFVQKGKPSSAREKIGNSSKNHILFNTTFTAQWFEGNITSPKIGPARDWKSFHWNGHALEATNNDKRSIDIIGIDQSGKPELLAEGIQSLDTSLAFISANQYPHIRLSMKTRDDSTRTPTQLDYWRVLYDKVPEAALNPNVHFKFLDDTLNTGQKMQFECAIENVTEIPMDSMLYKYTVTPPSNQSDVTYKRNDSLPGKEYKIATFDYPTDCINCPNGVNNFIVEANPDNDQPEQHHFNNFGSLQFHKVGDNTNPLLDVTFDGKHIMDGDLVSAEPDILIRLKDENKFLALNDTSLVNVFLKHPDGRFHRVSYSNPNVQFVPADDDNLEKNNSARILIKKDFEKDGMYELEVQGEDRSKNASGTFNNTDGIDYRVNFEVINEARISNVLNYPNPFTTQTRFVFTITGSEIPTTFKIQIMTVTGNVVEEITKSELGPLQIGRNVTDYAWDGTDRFGDPLGNGLYLYRVVTNINGQSMEHFQTGADKYFESGFGKMYLAR